MKTLRNIVLALAATLAGCGGSGSSTGTRFVPVLEKVVIASYVDHRDNTIVMSDRSADNTGAFLAVDPYQSTRAELVSKADAKKHSFWGIADGTVAFDRYDHPTANADIVVKDSKTGATVFDSNSPGLRERVLDTRGPVVFEENDAQAWAPKIKSVGANGVVDIFPTHVTAYAASTFPGKDPLVIARKRGMREELFAIDSNGSAQLIFDLNQTANGYGFFFPTTERDFVTVAQSGAQGTEFSFRDLVAGRESVVLNPFNGWTSVSAVSYDRRSALFVGQQQGATTTAYIRADISTPQGQLDAPVDFSQFTGWRPNYASLGINGMIIEGSAPSGSFPRNLVHRRNQGLSNDWPALIPSGARLESDRGINEYKGLSLLEFEIEDANGNQKESLALYNGDRLVHFEELSPVTGAVTQTSWYDRLFLSNSSRTSNRFAFVHAEKDVPSQSQRQELLFIDMELVAAVKVATASGFYWTPNVFAKDDSRVAFGLKDLATGTHRVYVADPSTLGKSAGYLPKEVGGTMDPFLELSIADRVIAVDKKRIIVTQGAELMAYDLNTGDRTRISVGQQ